MLTPKKGMVTKEHKKTHKGQIKYFITSTEI